MKTNFHTHTYRCHHARGTDREYVQVAVEKGLNALGFSDHSPYCFPDGYYSNFRMKLDEIEGYVSSIDSLRNEFKDKITIYTGYEMEYYPEYFEKTIKLIEGYKYDYIILGQHFINNEMDKMHSTTPTEDDLKLKTYVDTVIEGMKTLKYTFVAHPDVFNYVGDIKTYKKEMSRLCVAAKDLNIPLEYNLLGVRTNRFYPRKDFWEVVSEVGNDVVLGCDAHEPESIALESDISEATKFAQLHNLHVIELKTPIRK